MRILHLSNELDAVGNGITNVLVDLAIEQRSGGHRVAVASPAGTYQTLLLQHGIEHINLPYGGIGTRLAAARRLRRLIREGDYDIVHAHMVTGALVGRWATLGTATALVTHVHNSFQRHAVLMAVGDRVIAVSEAVRRQMIRRGIPSAKIRTVLNGTIGSRRIAPNGGDPAVELRRPAVLTVAGLYPRKGIADLLQAHRLLCRELPGVSLYVVGDGPHRAEYEALAAELMLNDCVTFLGYRSDAQSLMRQADVFVLASRADPNPLVLSEARYAGVPIVATEVDGVPEALEGGRAGLLVPPQEPRALARALRSVLLDSGARERLRQGAASNLDWLHVSRVARETMSVYEAAVKRPR